MENTTNINSEELILQNAIAAYLQVYTSSNGLSSNGEHLDEELLSAFVEGNLGKNESQPIMSHLVDCSFCRHITSELIKLDYSLADEPHIAVVADAAPSKISQVLSNVLSRIFGTNDGAVFAHHETEDPDDENNEEIDPEVK